MFDSCLEKPESEKLTGFGTDTKARKEDGHGSTCACSLVVGNGVFPGPSLHGGLELTGTCKWTHRARQRSSADASSGSVQWILCIVQILLFWTNLFSQELGVLLANNV